jgi:hypothetical protein
MSAGSSASAAPVVPWTERLFTTARCSTPTLGAILAGLAFGLFVLFTLVTGELGRVLRGEADPGWPEELRFSIVFCLLIGYAPAAFISTVRGARATLDALAPVLEPPPGELEALRGRAGRFEPGALRIAGTIGAAVALIIPFLIDLDARAYDLRRIGPVAISHRVMLGIAGWLLGRFIYALVQDSSRLDQIGRHWVRVDLLDTSGLTPFARHGLRNALLAMGLLSILALALVDWSARPGLPSVLALGMALTVGLAAAGLVLPMRGVRVSIQAVKRAELRKLAEQIRAARESASEPGRLRLADLVAYRGLIESVREWPLDAPTVWRFTLYVVIPLGSWLGGALVERLLDSFLG